MSSLARLTARVALLVSVGLSAGACGGPPDAKAPSGPARPLAKMLVDAFREEAHGDPSRAIELYTATLEAAGDAPDDAASVGTALAALDALVYRSPPSLSDASRSAALAHRAPGKARATLEARLEHVMTHARGPFVPGITAEALSALALRRGDAQRADTLRARSGCARTAVLVGPTSFLTVSGVDAKGAFDAFDAPMPTQVPAAGPFARKTSPSEIHATGCHLPLYAYTPTVGVRDLVVDVDVPAAQWIGVRLVSPATASLRVGGRVALHREPDATGYVARLSRVEIRRAGTVRLALRVGMDQDFQSVVLSAWDSSGRPLRAHAPAAGVRATSPSVHVAPVVVSDFARGPRVQDVDRVAGALAALAAGDERVAEDLLWARAKADDAPPEVLMAYGRAVRAANDLPAVKIAERARDAFDRALEKWPTAWEAALERAVLAGQRRGNAEARIASLADLDKTRAKAGASPMFDAFEAGVAGREGLHDRAKAAYQRAATTLTGTALLRDVERTVVDRTGQEAVAFECEPRGDNGADRAGLECYHARKAVGDRDGAEQELSRIRALYAAPQLYQTLSQRDAIERGDRAKLERSLAASDPSARGLAAVYALKGPLARADVLVSATSARDAPRAISSILTSIGEDPTKTFDGVTEAALAAPDKNAGEATVVLAHREIYDLRDDGLLHYLMLDVRRVHGTTDVDTNAQASSPMVFGRDAARVLRRRIFKKDGRVLLPEHTPRAAQAHADLSQLETGDAVEAIYEGWALPQESGHIGIDTPDLLPERTAVRDASIELHLPPGLRLSSWSHPLLGKAAESSAAGRRVLRFTLKDAPVRRIESGVPRMDNSVGVSLSTATWADVSANMRDVLLTLSARDAEVAAWAREAAGKHPPSEQLVDAVVTAAGKAITEASGSVLTDLDFGRAALQSSNARAALATHEGSRTWLIVRALRELGVPVDVVVAEDRPFSNSPDFPAHYGRFMHPLARVRLPGVSNKTKEIWIDADVSGPPLPAGRISPELRGREAIDATGAIFRLPTATGEGGRDEIDIRLSIDAKGDAHGTLTALLQGRAAQDLSEALVHLVGAERERALRGIALAWVPHATVDTVSLSSSEGSWQVAIRADLTVGSYAQVEGTKAETRTWVLPGLDPVHYVFPRPYVSTLGSTYASHGARENALAVSHAIQYHVRRRVDLPAKASIARLAGPFRARGPLLEAERKVSVNGATIEEDFTLQVSTGTVPREGYATFVSEAHRADDAFRSSTRIRPPPP
ncbi:MAG: hypothetical protein KC657_03385 [Myxococcales bacterium]|nr:hypothetical protein [Myxococcales bacterium]